MVLTGSSVLHHTRRAAKQISLGQYCQCKRWSRHQQLTPDEVSGQTVCLLIEMCCFL